jgi:glucose/arabinose dehydrogenase
MTTRLHRRSRPVPLAVESLESRTLYSLPAGFAQTTFASGLSAPTAMAFAPDGRLFVLEQEGAIRVVTSGGTLLSTPFATLPVKGGGEQGLLGIAFAPDYATTREVFVHWIIGTSQNRITKFTADASNPNVAAAGSQVDILTLPQDPNFGYNHQGGALGYGSDGKIYLTVGEHNTPSYAQTLTSPFGKILRLNRDGSFPTDNPFYATSTGWGQAVWALGLRNPYSFAFQPGTGSLLINDVGGGLREEVNRGVAGANYGWPTTEGSFNPSTYPQFTNPVFDYERGTVGCAIIGGTFYNPPAGASNPFPASYTGKYFFSDYCMRFIHMLDPSNGYSRTVFGTDNQLADEAVDVEVGPDGSLYGLARGAGAVNGAGVVVKISYTGSNAPVIGTNPQSQTITAGQPVTFTVAASGAAPLSYQWQRNGTNISGATAASYTIDAVQASDNGAQFRCVVTNSSGSATSNAATLTVTSNQAPTATITAPAAGATFGGGQTFNYSGTGTDPEDGTLGGASFTWWVDLHHDTHTHPFVPQTTGATSGSFTVPTVGETSANVWYRIHLTVTDSQGLTHSVFRDIQPRTANVTLATSPAGLSLNLDGAARSTPHSFTGVVGIVRSLGAPLTQVVGSTTYEFVSWSDSGARDHTIGTPTSDTTYTATYRVVDTSAPSITSHPQSVGVGVGEAATFTVTATGAAPLGYQWRRNGTNIPGATSASYTLAGAQLSDSGATFRCVVSNANGTATSNAATLTVATGAAPVATIGTPAAGSQFRGGETIAFSGSATDAEDGALSASAMTWEVVLHRTGSAVTVVAPFSASGGSFAVPSTSDLGPDAFYRIHLRVTDSDGLTDEATRDVNPHTAAVTVATNVPGLQLLVEGQSVAAPHGFTGVSGTLHAVEAPASQTVGDVTYDFVSWSDGGAAAHNLLVPDADTTFTATYQARTPPDSRYDLAAAVAGPLPAEVIGGDRGVARVAVSNLGTDLLTGFVTVNVYLSADGVLDANDALAGTVHKRVKLKPAGAKAAKVKVKLNYPALADGSYQLLARVEPDGALGEASDSNNVAAAAAPIVNHAPVFDFSGTIGRFPATVTRGRKGAVALSVLNTGNVVAAGPLAVRLYAATGNAPVGGLTQLGEVVRTVKIRPGVRKTMKLSFITPADLAPGTYYFVADIDPVAAHAETDELNNQAVAAGSFTVV